MPIDRYTKAVLTIIAAALLYIAAMLSGQPAAAQAQAQPPFDPVSTTPQPVTIVGWSAGTIPVTLQTARPVPVALQPGAQTLPVRLDATADNPLPVGITSIQAHAGWDPVRVRVEPAETSARPR